MPPKDQKKAATPKPEGKKAAPAEKKKAPENKETKKPQADKKAAPQAPAAKKAPAKKAPAKKAPAKKAPAAPAAPAAPKAPRKDAARRKDELDLKFNVGKAVKALLEPHFPGITGVRALPTKSPSYQASFDTQDSAKDAVAEGEKVILGKTVSMKKRRGDNSTSAICRDALREAVKQALKAGGVSAKPSGVFLHPHHVNVVFEQKKDLEQARKVGSFKVAGVRAKVFRG